MGGEDTGNGGYQQKNGDGICPSSSAAAPFFGSGWDPLVSLSHSENFGASSVVPHFGNSPYSVGYPSESGFVEMVPRLPCFGNGSLSEMVGSFGLPECGSSQGDPQISEEGKMEVSPGGKRKKRASESNNSKNGEGKHRMDASGDSSEDEKKQRTEQNTSTISRGKQMGKQVKDNCSSGDAPKENYIHMRAKRGQATNSHSLAERVRRERISERMRLLQELVPGCNKITGKAVMLDEIINYVQSLQQQVEFLSMKLSTVNPQLNIDLDRILSKEILHSRGSSITNPGFDPGMSSIHPYRPGIQQGSLPGIPSTSPYHHMSQNMWDNELQSLLQMGFDSNPATSNLCPNAGRSKLEL